MKSILRRDTGEDWRQYVVRLIREEGVVEATRKPTDEEIRRYDLRERPESTPRLLQPLGNPVTACNDVLT